jgi:hypothetical protein
MMMNQEQADEEILGRSVMRLRGTLLGLATGVILGLLIFMATIWLVLKGGQQVGPHLSLLSQFFWGYSVTVAGSFVGLAYGLVIGFVGGMLMAWIYNRVAGLHD